MDGNVDGNVDGNLDGNVDGNLLCRNSIRIARMSHFRVYCMFDCKSILIESHIMCPWLMCTKCSGRQHEIWPSVMVHKIIIVYFKT